MSRSISTFVILLVVSATTPAFAELVIGECPEEAPQCGRIQVTLSTDEGHEWSTIHFEGLSFVSGHHDHYGWTGASPGASCGTTAYEWGPDYQGPPTYTLEVTGETGTKAKVWATYIGGSWGMPVRTTEISEIEITGPMPTLTLEDLKVGAGPDGKPFIDGRDSTVIKVTADLCGVPLKDETLSFETDLGQIGKSAIPYTVEHVNRQGYDYVKERKNNVLVTLNEDGEGWVTLTAHPPVIRNNAEHSIRPRDTLVYNHGESRSAHVIAWTFYGGKEVQSSIDIEMVPGTNMEKVEELYKGALYDNKLRTYVYAWGMAMGNLPFGQILADTFTGPANNLVSASNLLGDDLVPTRCQNYQSESITFLDGLRRDPRTAALVDGYDWAPVNSLLGMHKAVVVYEHGTDWKDGMVFDPWWSGKVTVYSSLRWTWPGSLWGGDAWIDGDNLFDRDYPLTGGGEDLYPVSGVNLMSPTCYFTLSTHSPILPLLTDSQGRRSGVLPDGTAVGEIPGTILEKYEFEDGDVKYYLEVEDTDGTLSVHGTADGSFGVSAIRCGQDGVKWGAEWAKVPITEGEGLTVALPESGIFMPMVRADGEQIWPLGSEAFTKIKAALKVKAPGKDSVALKAVWLNGGADIDPAADDMVVSFGDLEFTIPAGEAKVSKRGKVSYKALLPDGEKLKITYIPKKGKLTVSAKKLDLTGLEPGSVSVSCVCGERGAERAIVLIPKGKTKLVFRE